MVDPVQFGGEVGEEGVQPALGLQVPLPGPEGVRDLPWSGKHATAVRAMAPVLLRVACCAALGDLLWLGAAAENWKVLPNTDFPNNGGGPRSPAVKAESASGCADECQKLPGCVAVVWNSKSDHGCNFKCNTKGKLTKADEEAVVVRPGKDTCQLPPPPPAPPPPPTPATLCPDSMPTDWKAPCEGGDLFFSSDQSGLMPTIGNGALATFVKSDVIYAGGLFNGDSMGAKGPVSHRAAIPAYHISLASGDLADTRALDVRRAVFIERTTVNSTLSVEDRYYVALDKPNVIVHEMTFTAAAGAAPVRVVLQAKEAPKSPDLNLTKLRPMMGGPVRWQGSNLIGELGNQTTLAVVSSNFPDEPPMVSPGAPVTLYFLTVIVTSLNSTQPLQDASRIYASAMEDKEKLFSDHVAAWATRWQQGSLEVAGDLHLAQALNSSLYAIRSSIRADWPYGLSPGGLASNAYEGHTFWDQETWMWPPLLMLDPPCAKSALDYRWNRREGAHLKATVCGTPNHASSGGQGTLDLPDDALMFPWESCLTGHEVQFGRGKIGEWGEYEQHISGDIVQAARQYWYATADKDWLEEIGFPLAKGVAEFYAKRVTPRAYTVTTRGSAPVYDMNDVMGPDEYAFPVNNSAYTNAAAAIALNFATEAAGVLGKPADPSWATVAEGLALKISDHIPLHPELKGGYHPEYDGFPKNPKAPRVKQADTILLSYPLGFNMSATLLSNDLTVYDPITDPEGPAMTWSMFAVGWINAGDFNRSAGHFQRGYAPVHPPFNVWTESPNGGGTVNFITGAGGFLQSAIFGTSGMRLVSDGLTFNPPPPRATGSAATLMGVTSFHFRGHRLSQQVTEDSMTYSVLSSDASSAALTLSLEADGSTHALKLGSPVTAARGRAKITLAAA